MSAPLLREALIRAELIHAALVSALRHGLTPAQVDDMLTVSACLVDTLEEARQPALDLAAIRRDGGPVRLRVVGGLHA